MNFIRQLFVENLTLKLISLILASLLWIQIAGQQRVQRSTSVPVEFINMPSGLEIVSELPREVTVVISKPSSVRMDERDLAAVIDLRGAEPGTAIFPLTERSIRNIPSGVEVEDIVQRRLKIEFERTRRKIVKVEPEIIGQPPAGYQVGDVRLNPSEVLISGPESRLEEISTAETEPLDVAGRIESFSQTVYLDLEDPTLRTENTASVEVFIVIEEERRQITIKAPVRVLPKEVNAAVRPRRVDVVISVPISYSEEVEASEFDALVSLTEQMIAADQPVELSPTVIVPDPYRAIVRIESVEPQQVTITP